MGLDCALDVDVGSAVITVTVTAENTGSEPVDLTFPNSQVVEVVAERDGDRVWRFGEGRMFTQALRTETVGAGERLTETITWPTPDAGAYDLRAWLCAKGVDCEASARVTVEQ